VKDLIKLWVGIPALGFIIKQILTSKNKQNMKNLITIVALMMCSVVFSQQEIVTTGDEMSTKITTSLKYPFNATNDAGTDGFVLTVFLNVVKGKPSMDKYTNKYVSLSHHIDGVSCTEDLSITFKFADGSLLETSYASDFECDGGSLYAFSAKEISILASKRITKVKLQDGRSYKSITVDIESDKHGYYFRDVVDLLKAQ